MNNQIQLYHDLTTFYLSTEEQLRCEIARLNQQLATLEQKLKERESELRAEARRQYFIGYEQGRRQGDKVGYDRAYHEAINKAEWVFDFKGVTNEVEALKALNLDSDLHEKVFDICERFYERGWTVARKEYAVTYQCCECRKIIELTSKDAKKAARQYMEEHKWGHKSCVEGKH